MIFISIRKASKYVSNNASCWTWAVLTSFSYLIGSEACPSPQLLVSNNIHLHDDKLLQLFGVA